MSQPLSLAVPLPSARSVNLWKSGRDIGGQSRRKSAMIPAGLLSIIYWLIGKSPYVGLSIPFTTFCYGPGEYFGH